VKALHPRSPTKSASLSREGAQASVEAASRRIASGFNGVASLGAFPAGGQSAALGLPVVTLLPHVGELLAQERNHGIGSGVLARRWP
jgi:hypothetical protein